MNKFIAYAYSIIVGYGAIYMALVVAPKESFAPLRWFFYAMSLVALISAIVMFCCDRPSK